MRNFLSLLLVLTGCATARPATPAAPPSEATQLAEDTPTTTASGAKFTAPKGWWLLRRGGLIVLQDPEKDLSVAFAERAAKNADEAVAAAWQEFAPGFARVARNTVRPPPRDGWDEIQQTFYEVPAAEARTVIAAARRKGATWYLALIDGADPAMERRGAQMSIAVGSLKVAGQEEEDLSKKEAHPLDAARAEKLAAFVEGAMKDSEIPGAAVAVVQGGKVVFARGFGVKELGKGEPVTPRTLFLIGSTSKSLTTLMMAKLVDEGRFSWDTPITKLMPSFALGDAEATRKLTVAYTVCACTGLPRQDMEFIFEFAHATPESRILSMRGMKPTTGFGETFQYSNLMVSAGGYVAALAAEKGKKLDSAYDAVLESRVLGPLSMKVTTGDTKLALKRDHAMPHGKEIHDEPMPIPVEYEGAVTSVLPAGGLWSSAEDMARWELLELGNGKLDGKQLVSEANLLERRKPRVQLSAKASYGLGLFVDRSRGLLSVGHGGNTLGFTSDETFFPEKGFGIVTLANVQVANAFTGAVRRRLVELLLDAREEAAESLAFSRKEQAIELAKDLKEIALVPDRAFVTPLVGRWKNASLGPAEIRLEPSGGATFDAGEWKSPLGIHTAPDGTRKLILTGAPLAGLAFWPKDKDGKTALLFETAQQKYWFERAEK
jgi:CubicO group peptidase (beta-lactamase class C family)